jgi:hypothetical protein
MMPAALAACVVILGAALAWRKGHYIFALFLLLIGAYELTAPIAFSVLNDGTLRGLQIFEEYANAEAVGTFSTAALLFFALLISAYVTIGTIWPLPYEQSRPGNDYPYLMPTFTAVIMVFGIASVITGAGQSRLEDYVGGEGREASRFLFYGALLLVVATALLVDALAGRRWAAALWILICLTPLVIESYAAGRRQVFAPSVLYIVACLVYSNLRHKFFSVAAILAVVLTIFALQFSLRQQIQVSEHVYLDALPDDILAPQAGEFVAIGSTTFYAWNFMESGDVQPTWGKHWLFHLLNAAPFVKFGDLLFAEYRDELTALYWTVSPWGGLSVLCDSILGLGELGIGAAAILLALLLRAAHHGAVRALRAGSPRTAETIYVLSLIATLIPKYRSGWGDIIQSFVAFSLLYWTIAWVGILVMRSAMQSLKRENA